MKRTLSFLTALFLCLSLGAQDVEQHVISSAGSFDVSGDNSVSLSWTLGELVVTTAESSDGSLILTQGFQQSKLIIDGIELNPELGVEVTVYPNPVNEIVNIKFSEQLKGETMIFLSGPDGRLIYNEALKPGVLIREIYMDSYPSGTYFLRIQNGNKLNVYKIIKL
ncbi:MAG: T9SS type A sorting domain-containing protein [Bacteroidales bacterium]